MSREKLIFSRQTDGYFWKKYPDFVTEIIKKCLDFVIKVIKKYLDFVIEV